MDGISLYDDCVMLAYNKEVRRNCLPFTCGENDLDDFFLNDADLYADELLGKTYCWVTTEIPHRIVALFTLSNDSIKTRLISPNDKNRLQRNIVNPKRGRSYPAVLIGRLGVNLEYQGTSSHVGRQLMAFIKDWFRHEDNKTGCRFIVVDAYNEEKILRYYERNGFVRKYSINSLVYWVTYVHNVVYSFYRSMIYCYINSTQRCAGSIVIDIIPTNGADKRKFFPFAPYFPVTNVIKRYFYPYFPAIIGIKGYSFPYFPYLSGIMKIKTALYSLFSRLDWHKTVVFPCLGEIYEGIRSLSWEIPVT